MSETVVAGIVIPSTSAIFLAGVGVHVAFALVAVAAGLGAMLSPKGLRRHRRFGRLYVWALTGVVATAAALALARWAQDKALFVLALIAFAAGWYGRWAQRRAWPGWVRHHIAAMGGSYVTMLTAFYVDNGRSLPIWRSLPTIAYWAVPSLVGAPIILAAMLRHPLAARPGRGPQGRTP